MSRASVIASVFALGVVLMLVASPASAQRCGIKCNCTSSCDEPCLVGNINEGFEEITCGEWGICIDSGGCTPGGDCPALACGSTTNGTSGGDTMTGGSGHECINGNGGADTINGNAGDDTIQGGDGDDTIYGGSGNDCLYGGNGNDNVNGDSGTDHCIAETELTCEL